MPGGDRGRGTEELLGCLEGTEEGALRSCWGVPSAFRTMANYIIGVTWPDPPCLLPLSLHLGDSCLPCPLTSDLLDLFLELTSL